MKSAVYSFSDFGAKFIARVLLSLTLIGVVKLGKVNTPLSSFSTLISLITNSPSPSLSILTS